MRTASYAEIQKVLHEAHSLADAAEAHGTLTGSFCAAVGYGFSEWLQEILPEGQANPEVSRTLQELFTDTAEALSASEMQFEPLLPQDEEPIDARAAALGQWCQGFLYGLGVSALPDASQLPGEVGEIVRDITEISRVGVDRAESDESNESAYSELVEFVRVGVQLVFEELEPLRARAEQPPGPGESLH